jgi:hypothetical protein
MIPVVLPLEPKSFDSRVRQPGLQALRDLGHDPNVPVPNERIWKTAHQTLEGGWRKSLNYWTRARDELCTGYHRRCVYSCFTIEPVLGCDGKVLPGDYSIDHFAPKSLGPAREAFEWSNLRWCWSVINNKKADSCIAVDPVSMSESDRVVELEEDVKGNWMVIPAQDLTVFTRDQVQDTIDRLGLNSIRTVVGRRNQFVIDFISNAHDYSDADMLDRQPFIFSELRRLGRI